MGHTAQTDSTDIAPSAEAAVAAASTNTVSEPPLAATPADTSGAFAPLRIPLFRDRWLASTVSSVGTWMQDTAGTWLMTVLTTSPLLIALMQTAASMPVLLLGLLAGATADIYERRRLLIFWQSWMLVCVAILAVLTFAGWVSPLTLLTLTFLLNVGSAMNNPAWQAIVPELVPREEIPNAVTLNAASNNIARAVGPALGGLLVAAFAHAHTGAGWTFAFNSASFIAVIWILWRWHRTPIYKSALPAERIFGSVRSGLRYLRYSPTLQGPLIRAFTFTFFVSAVWSLLALVARKDMHQGAMGYGILNGSLGVGAVVGASTLARIRKRFNADQLLTATTLYYVLTMLVLGFVPSPFIIIPTLIGAGFCWTCTMSTLNVSVQLSVPNWVYARALGAYLMTFQGGLALGSIVWGAIAPALIDDQSPCAARQSGSLSPTRSSSASTSSRGRCPTSRPTSSSTPRRRSKTPPRALCASPSSTPSPPPTYPEFSHLIHQLEGVRLRGGAVRWGIYRDAANPEHLNETFIMESWLDYLRSRERMTAADQAIRQTVWALHQGPELPHVTYQIWAREVPLAPLAPLAPLTPQIAQTTQPS